MKTSFVSIFRNSSVYGLIYGALSIVISLLLYIFNVNMFSIVFGIISFLLFVLAIPITFAVLGGNNLRLKHAPDRQITYLDACISCFIILIIGLLLSNLYNYVFNNFIDPEYMKQQMEKFVEMLQSYNTSEEEIEKTIASTEKRFSLVYMLVSSLVISAALSLIVSIFIRRKDKLDEKMI